MGSRRPTRHRLASRDRVQVTQLAGLIELINGELTKLDRKKLITLCTIDVHARDVVQRLIDERVESGTAFQWQSQLRYVVNEKSETTQVRGRGWLWGECERPTCSGRIVCSMIT